MSRTALTLNHECGLAASIGGSSGKLLGIVELFLVTIVLVKTNLPVRRIKDG